MNQNARSWRKYIESTHDDPLYLACYGYLALYMDQNETRRLDDGGLIEGGSEATRKMHAPHRVRPRTIPAAVALVALTLQVEWCQVNRCKIKRTFDLTPLHAPKRINPR